MKFIISCDEATTICDKNQYGEASFSEKMKLSFHLMFCKFCKTYSKQNGFMSKIFAHFAQNCESEHHLTEEEKEEMNQKLSKDLH